MIWETPFKYETKVEKCVYSTVKEVLQGHARETPDKKVLISAEDPTSFLTYTQLLDQIRAAELFLHKIGFKKGDVGIVILPAHVEIIAFYMALLGRGGVYSGLLPVVTECEVFYQVNVSGASVVLTTSQFLEKVKAAIAKIPRKITIITLDDSEQFTWTYVIKSEGEAPKIHNDLNDMAVLPFSSGTTGHPKGVMLSHMNLLHAALNLANHMKDYLPKPKNSDGKLDSPFDRYQILSSPPFHISGKYLVLAYILGGAQIVILKQFDFKLFLKSIQDYKAWNLIISPPILLQMIKDPIMENYDMSSLGYISTSSAPLGEKLAAEFVKKYPHIMLTQIYGLTECLPPVLTLNNKLDSITSGSVSPDYQVKIVDIKTGDLLGPNLSGEVLVKGPSVMLGYLNQPEMTKAVITPEGWLHTGDVGYFNDEGDLYLIDRVKEMIKVNAMSVSPGDLESTFAADPRIKDVGVFGTPHPTLGHVPVACIVKKDPELTEADVQQLIKERLANYKWPQGHIVFVDTIPKLPSGKILRRKLAESVIVN